MTSKDNKKTKRTNEDKPRTEKGLAKGRTDRKHSFTKTSFSQVADQTYLYFNLEIFFLPSYTNWYPFNFIITEETQAKLIETLTA